MKNIAILGAGAWGTALAFMFARQGYPTYLYTHRPELIDHFNFTKHHAQFPKLECPPSLKILGYPKEFENFACIVSVVPAQFTDQTFKTIKLVSNVPIIICSKGLEKPSGTVLSEVVKRYHNNPVAALSGPSFAHEVMIRQPTALLLACEQPLILKNLLTYFQDPYFRVYGSKDLKGVQWAGALKNVLAIAAGIVIGGGYGENARAALLTRGLREMTVLGEKIGAQVETFYSLAGIGDLMLTAHSQSSRNFKLGVMIANQQTHTENELAEGFFTAQTLIKIMQHHDLDLPVLFTTSQILAGELTVKKALKSLIGRPLKALI